MKLLPLIGIAGLFLTPGAAPAAVPPRPAVCAAVGPCAHPLPVK